MYKCLITRQHVNVTTAVFRTYEEFVELQLKLRCKFSRIPFPSLGRGFGLGRRNVHTVAALRQVELQQFVQMLFDFPDEIAHVSRAGTVRTTSAVRPGLHVLPPHLPGRGARGAPEQGAALGRAAGRRAPARAVPAPLAGRPAPARVRGARPTRPAGEQGAGARLVREDLPAPAGRRHRPRLQAQDARRRQVHQPHLQLRGECRRVRAHLSPLPSWSTPCTRWTQPGCRT